MTASHWLGGFTIVGAIVAAVAFAVLFAGETILYLLAIAVPGAIVGFLMGVGVAQVIVVVAEELGWSPPPSPPLLAPGPLVSVDSCNISRRLVSNLLVSNKEA
jgi:hypothetical protein